MLTQSSQQPMPKVSICCVAPFNNPHIVPMYDAIADQENVSVTRVSVHPVSRDRLALGWPEMAPDAPYLQPWRRMGDRLRYFKAILTHDVIIFPGFFHFRTLPLHHWLRRLTCKPTLLWSEPFLGHPRTSRSRLSLWMRRLLLAPCDSPNVHLLATGRGAEGDFYRLGMHRWKAWVFGFSTHYTRRHLDLSVPATGTIQLVYSGALVARKGVDVLLDALGQPDLANRDWHLTILGDGPSRADLEKQIQRLNLSTKVELTGALAIQDCTKIYQRSHILILPSRFDGWGAVLNEAMDHGLAVIASDKVGATRPLMAEGRTGFIFHSEKSDDLARRLLTLLDDRDLLRRMRQAAFDRAAMFHPDEAARRVTALCRGLAGLDTMPTYGQGYCTATPMQANPVDLT